MSFPRLRNKRNNSVTDSQDSVAVEVTGEFR